MPQNPNFVHNLLNMSDSNESGDDDAKPMNGPEKKSKASNRVKSIYNVVSGALEGACCARDESGGQMAEHEVFFSECVAAWQ